MLLSNLKTMSIKYCNLFKSNPKLAIPMMMAACALGLSSCNDKNDEFDDKGSVQVVSIVAPSTVNMGDSVEIKYSIKANVFRANQSKIQLYLGGEMVSERMMTTPENGEYSSKIYIPYYKGIEDQEVTVKVRTQNERFAAATAEQTMQLVRPKYDKLYLVDSEGKRHVMLPSASDPFLFTVTDEFPSELYATIVAPAYGENGNEIVFGSSDGAITNGVTDNINFSADEDSKYTVTFNTKTYQGTPFIKFAVNGVEFVKVDNNNFKVDGELKQGQDIEITGLKSDYANYWINPTFFEVVKGTNGKKLRFRGQTGQYRITCDKSKKYFRVLPLGSDGSSLADLTKNEPGVWVIGDGNIGFPSYKSNKSNWGPKETNAIPFCPMGNNIYELVLLAGTNLNPGSINYKCFYQNGWGTEFVYGNYASCDGVQPYFVVNPSDGNIKKGSAGITSGKYYRLRMDLSNGPKKTVLTCTEEDQIPEIEP